jgi:ribosomal protein S18 acetylase RimI-like enzyme
MEFVRITQAHPFLDSIQGWYETSFPPPERRTFNDLLQLLPHPDMHVCGLVSEDQLVGFIVYWPWEEFLFVEHVAIDPNRRGRQLGHQAIEHVLRLTTPYVVLEVELPEDDFSIRRIQFYERLGFHLTTFSYAQPPYQRGEPSIPMQLMSIPAITHPNVCTAVANTIRERVYERFYKPERQTEA